MTSGSLFLVATPIGNLADITLRALEILREVDLIAAEDTRHSRRLLDHFNIKSRLVALHDHNEAEACDELVRAMQQGQSIALISDAGTPLVSDPGYRLVQAAIEAGLVVTAIPGPSAVMASLAVAGLAVDRFCFEGFLPAKQAARKSRLEAMRDESRTMVFFEAPHRMKDFIEDAGTVFGEDRQVAIARELTKKFEQVWRGSLGTALGQLASGDIPEKGEFAVVIGGNPAPGAKYDDVLLMETLLTELSPSAAATVASRLTGESKRRLYDVALAIKKR